VAKVYLLTGRPGVGKTTLIKEVVKRLGARVGGFFTEEIRWERQRQGFRLVTFDGQEAILAHVNQGGPYRVGKYGVNINGLEEVGVSALRRGVQGGEIIVIDEIGKMELFSPAFRQAVEEAIGSGKPVIGTIMQGPHPWADGIKRHPRVELLTLTGGNHQEIGEYLLKELKVLPSP